MDTARTSGPEQVLAAGPNQGSAGPDGAARPLHIPLANLRSFVIVLVVAHHAALAYNDILPTAPAASLVDYLQSMNAVSPVNDAQRSGLLSLFAAFNEAFMMPLLFFLSGLFVWGSLQRKGGASYLKGRLVRLGIPLIAMVVLRPLTYLPTYFQTGGDAGLAGFWQQWSAVEWRGGPIWFLELLLIFDILFVLAAPLLSGLGSRASKWMSSLAQRPGMAFLGLVLLTTLAYLPVTLRYGSFYWLQVGPAQLQINRLLFYAAYFLAGIALGAHGIDRSFLVPESRLARRWPIWTLAALAFFVVHIGLAIGGAEEALVGFFALLSGAAISFAFLALFLRFSQRQGAAARSLFRNSYGIYVVHYGVVSYLLYAMLAVQLPAMSKWLIVFPAALAICWTLVAGIRRIPGVARVI